MSDCIATTQSAARERDGVTPTTPICVVRIVAIAAGAAIAEVANLRIRIKVAPTRSNLPLRASDTGLCSKRPRKKSFEK
jgi:hypothetical protein